MGYCYFNCFGPDFVAAQHLLKMKLSRSKSATLYNVADVSAIFPDDATVKG